MSKPVLWYYAINRQQQGPVVGDEIKKLLQNGQLQGSDLVWRSGMTTWQPASSCAELMGNRAMPANGADDDVTHLSRYPALSPRPKSVNFKLQLIFLAITGVSLLIFFLLPPPPRNLLATLLIIGILAFVLAMFYPLLALERLWRVLYPTSGIPPVLAVILIIVPLVNLIGFAAVITTIPRRYRRVVAQYNLSDAPVIQAYIYYAMTLLFYPLQIVELAQALDLFKMPIVQTFLGYIDPYAIAVIRMPIMKTSWVLLLTALFCLPFVYESGRIIDYLKKHSTSA